MNMSLSPKVIYVIHEKESPSTDFYIKSRFSDKNKYRVFYWSLMEQPIPKHQDVTIVFVRYISKSWKKWITQNASNILKIIYFMDDDLLDVKATKGLPWRYRLKIFLQITCHKKWLFCVKPEFWFSTAWLCQKYSELAPRLTSPKPIDVVDKSPLISVFYHGSITHYSEIDWLYDVFSEVLAKRNNVLIEVVGDKNVFKRLRSLERVYVLNLIFWPSYKALIKNPGRHIGLVPLTNNPFNQARSCIKFFDITMAGAVGIYAAKSECRRYIRHNENGYLLEMDKQLWVDHIIQLVDHIEERDRMYKNAESTLLKLQEYKDTH